MAGLFEWRRERRNRHFGDAVDARRADDVAGAGRQRDAIRAFGLGLFRADLGRLGAARLALVPRRPGRKRRDAGAVGRGAEVAVRDSVGRGTGVGAGDGFARGLVVQVSASAGSQTFGEVGMKSKTSVLYEQAAVNRLRGTVPSAPRAAYLLHRDIRNRRDRIQDQQHHYG